MVYVSGITYDDTSTAAQPSYPNTSLPDPAAIGAATGGYSPPPPVYNNSLPDPAAIQAAQGGYTPPPAPPVYANTALPDPAAIQAAQGGYTAPPPPVVVPSNVSSLNFNYGAANTSLPDPAAIAASQGGYSAPVSTAAYNFNPQPSGAAALGSYYNTSLPEPAQIQSSQGGYPSSDNLSLPDPAAIGAATGGYTAPLSTLTNYSLPLPAQIQSTLGGASNVDQMPGYAPINVPLAAQVMGQNNAGSWTDIFNSYLPQSILNKIPNPGILPLRSAVGGITSPAGLAGLLTGVDEGLGAAGALGEAGSALGSLGSSALRGALGWGYGTEAANRTANSPLADIPGVGPYIPYVAGALAGGVAGAAPEIGRGILPGAEGFDEGATAEPPKFITEPAPDSVPPRPPLEGPPRPDDLPPPDTASVAAPHINGPHGLVANALDTVLGGRLTSSDLGSETYAGNGILPTFAGEEGLSTPQLALNIAKKVTHVGTPDDPVVTPLTMERSVGLRAAQAQAVRIRNMALAVDNLFDHPQNGAPDEVLVEGKPQVLSDGRALTPGKESVSIQDIAAHLPEYRDRLTPQQIQGITALGNEWTRYRALGNAMGRDIGQRADIQEGGFYLPRGNAAEDGVPQEFVSRRPSTTGRSPRGAEKTAKFESMAEGKKAGYTYLPFAEANYFTADGLGRSFVQQVADDTMNRLEEEGKVTPAGRAAYEAHINPHDSIGQALSTLGRAINLPLNALHTTLDLAFSGRLLQAATIDPRAYGQAFAVTVRSVADSASFGKFLLGAQDMADRLGEAGPRELVSDGLILHNLNPDIGHGLMDVPIVRNIPGVRGLSTAFGTFSDTLRVIMGMHAYSLATDAGLDMTDAGLRRDITGGINKVTGAATHQFTGLNAFVAFPNWITSQMQMALDAVTKGNMEGAIARRAIVSTVGIWVGATYLVNGLQGKPTTWQYGLPRMQIGSTTVTIPGKYSQIAQAVLNTTKDLATQNYGDAAHQVGNLYRKNASPVIGIATDIAKGANVVGDEVRNPEGILREFAPFNASEIGKKGFLSSGLSAAGLSSYEPYPPTQYQIRNALAEMTSSGKQYSQLAPKERGIVTGMMGGPIPSTNPVVTQSRQDAADNKSLFQSRQQDLDNQLQAGTINGSTWRDQYHMNLQYYLGQQDQLYRHSTGTQYTSDVDKATQAYAQEVDTATNADGTVDWDAVDAWAAAHPDIASKVNHAAGITPMVDQYHTDESDIEKSGYFDITSGLWSQLQQKTPALQQFKSLDDMESQAEADIAKGFIQQGIDADTANAQAAYMVTNSKFVQAVGDMRRKAIDQWVIANPDLARKAEHWGYLTTTVAERKLLGIPAS